jgi:hypothetical protein
MNENNMWDVGDVVRERHGGYAVPSAEYNYRLIKGIEK